MTQAPDDSAALQAIVEDLAYHQARVLLLVRAVSASVGHSRKLDGLTKLAKMDFLIRYPALAPTVLDQLSEFDSRLHVSVSEVAAPTEVQDPMTRYKFGPWDDRYYPVIGALISRGLVKYLKGRRGSVALRITAAGEQFAAGLTEDSLWRETAERCEAITEASSGLSGNALKDLVYGRLADLMDRPHREVIA